MRKTIYISPVTILAVLFAIIVASFAAGWLAAAH